MQSARFETNLNFLDRFFKKTPVPIFTEILPVGAAMMLADRQTDRQTKVRTDMMKDTACKNYLTNN